MQNKGRKKKVRYIQSMPDIALFSPRGKPGRPDEILLNVDEFEAFKLFDYQCYSQSEGASQMGMSRPSFGRILRSARKKIADAIINGKIIRIKVEGIQIGVRRKNLPQKEKNNVNFQESEEKLFRKNILKSGKII